MTEVSGGREVPSGTVTFLFTDVEGSTRLWAADQASMSASLSVHDAIVRSAIEGNGGYVFTTAGDSFAAAFARASDAVRASTEAQRTLAGAAWPGPVLKVRMGLHLGEAEERGGDYFGPVVNIAARVEAAGHGGQVLLTDAVRSAAGATDVVDLGVRHVRDVTEPVRLFQLGTEVFPVLRVVDPSLSNLPVRPTRLVGRDGDIAEVRQALTRARLVTITAVGGSGKTRVALAVGEAEMQHRPAGVWFVDLTAVMNDDEVPGAIASVLGLALGAGDLTAGVIAYLADKAALVVLDNCEHLIDACAGFAEAFLAVGGAASILATSREALAIDGEQVVVLPPLPADSADAPAVRLFVDRATALDPRFELTAGNSETVATICRRLDGMPLAIELAAARCTVMSPAELLAGLDDRFRLLSGGRRRQRTRTLEATLDWSYDLLDAQEQRVLRALGVFVDGFDVDAVAMVTGTSRNVALDTIEALVAKSLVDRADQAGLVRFRLLETVKAYAEDRLVDAGEAEVARGRHLDHFHRLTTVHGRIIEAEYHLSVRLVPDRSNITSAFEWAASTADWVRSGELLLGAVGAHELDYAWADALILLDRAIAGCAPLDVDLTERLKAIRVRVLVILFHPEGVMAAVELRASEIGPVRATAFAAIAFFATTIAQHNYEKHRDIAEQHIAALTGDDTGNVASLSRALLAICNILDATYRGDDTAALRHAEHLVLIGRQYPTVFNLTFGLSLLPLCHALLGDTAAARRMHDDAKAMRNPELDADIPAIIELEAGDIESATVEIRRHAERAVENRYIGATSNTLIFLASLSRLEGDDDRARELLAQVVLTRNPVGQVYGDRLAQYLGMVDEHRARKRSLDGAYAAFNAADMVTVRAEMTRRGWL
jgi:predicted ATPase/class 3 adenylate cyclase